MELKRASKVVKSIFPKIGILEANELNTESTDDSILSILTTNTSTGLSTTESPTKTKTTSSTTSIFKTTSINTDTSTVTPYNTTETSST